VDSIILIFYLLLFLAVMVAVYLIISTVKEAVNSPTGQRAVDWVEGTMQSGADLLNAAATGNVPLTPGPNQDDPAVNYFASVHDQVAHTIDSLKVLFSW